MATLGVAGKLRKKKILGEGKESFLTAGRGVVSFGDSIIRLAF
jgi:hypothetical protein